MPTPSHNPFPILEDHLGQVADATGVETWVEETYGDTAWMPPDAPATSQFIGLAAKRNRLAVFFVFLLALFLALWGKTGYLIAQSGSFKARSDLNRIRSLVTPAPRGVIYDANGVQLTDNIPDLKLALVPADLPADQVTRAEAIAKISAIAQIDPVAVERSLDDFGTNNYQPVTIAENISRDQAVELTIAMNDFPAIRILNGSHRYYALANTVSSLAHVLGYMGRITADDLKDDAFRDYKPTESIGRTGLEYVYEKQLRGTPGIKQVEVDALGHEVGVIGQNDPIAGENLRLTLDSELTAAAEKSIKAMMAKDHLTKGAVVVEDVRNGGILALVSLPSYSDNRFSEGISQNEYTQLLNDPDRPLFNRAVSGVYPPGSTAKLMVAAAALSEGVITPKTTVNSVGGIMYGGKWWFPDWKAGGHGLTDVKKALAWSVNTFFYMVGGGLDAFAGLGVDRLDRYFSLFGVGQKLGIDLPNEAAGLVPTPAWKKSATNTDWYIGDTYHISIGQGDLLATPLQMASWTATVANGGTVWRPHLALTAQPTSIRTKVIADAYLATVRAGLRDTVTLGSAQSLKTCLMPVAGKTGTAQVSGKDNHAWFTGYGPADDPQIAVTVLVENGKEGSTVAVPIAHEIFDWYAQNRMKHKP